MHSADAAAIGGERKEKRENDVEYRVKYVSLGFEKKKKWSGACTQ